MSIIPGIEIAAPERTETRSGWDGIAEPLRGTLLEPLDVTSHLVVEAGRHRLAGRHVGAAGVGRDREPGRHRHAERSHLREPHTLAAEELAAPARVLVEIEDVVHDDRSSTCSGGTVCEDAAVQGHVVAMGGFDEALIRFAVELSGAARPRVLFVPTAIADAAEVIADFYETAAERHLDPDHLELFGVPDDPLRRIERAEVILVNGGNTANMLAVWRVHGVDSALLAAWQRGAVLVGWSAGANCWFESSVTDSFGATLGPLHDGLGLLGGSFCPHFDGEGLRRPVHEELVGTGHLPPGLACDDAAAVHFCGTSLVEAVATRPDARAWRVTPTGSEPLVSRALTP